MAATGVDTGSNAFLPGATRGTGIIVLPIAMLPFTQRETPAVVWPLFEAARFGGDFKEAVRGVIRSLGFEWFRWVVSYRDGTGFGADHDLLNGGPGEWADLYRARNYRASDPLFREALERGVPRIWDQGTHHANPAWNEIYEAAAFYGMGHGVHMVVHDGQPGALNYFIVAGPERRMGVMHRKAVVQSFPALWAVAAYGRKLLPPGTRFHRGGHYRLSAREIECLRYVAQGMTSRAIGDALDISERTVDVHVASAIRKTGARNRTEALARALHCGLLTSERTE